LAAERLPPPQPSPAQSLRSFAGEGAAGLQRNFAGGEVFPTALRGERGGLPQQTPSHRKQTTLAVTGFFSLVQDLMRLVIQRVKEASVVVADELVAAIGPGYLVLVGVTHDDDAAKADWLARKVAGLRLFEDDHGLTNLSLADVGGEVLAVSQFTLYANARKGRRPSFVAAARPEVAEPLFQRFVTSLQKEGVSVQTGVFGAHMHVALINDGPVTLIIER